MVCFTCLATCPYIVVYPKAALVKFCIASWYHAFAVAPNPLYGRATATLNPWKAGGKLSKTCPAWAQPTCPKWDTVIVDTLRTTALSCNAKDPHAGHGSLLAVIAAGSTVTAAVVRNAHLVKLAGLTVWHALHSS